MSGELQIERAAHAEMVSLQNVRIDHRRRKFLVSEQFLNRADVPARFPTDAWRTNDAECDNWPLFRRRLFRARFSEISANRIRTDDAGRRIPRAGRG
jgi:hypothetical protein